MIVPADSPAKQLSDLRGKNIAFGDPASTSGTWIPRYQLVEAGLVAGRDYTKVVLGAHDAVARAVVNRTVDGGGISLPIYKRLIAEASGRELGSGARRIHANPRIYVDVSGGAAD